MRFLPVLIFAVFLGCSYSNRQPVVETVTPVWENTFDSTLFQERHFIAKSLTEDFYRLNHFRFVWVDTAGTLPHGDTMVTIIRNAARYGLNPLDYHVNTINALLLMPKAAPEKMHLDLYLTDGFFAMHHHLKRGRIANKSLNRIDLASLKTPESLSALQTGLLEGNIRKQLDQQEPGHDQYHLLKAELRKLLALPSPDQATLSNIAKLQVNMERWRWMEKPLPERYIAVNTPSFRLRVVDHDSVYLESKVIVGRKQTQTPELTSVIRSFTIYPYWHVPRSIVKEILPNIQKDSTYMARRNYQVLGKDGKVIDPATLDWQSFDENNFPYTLRQREGSENTMGVIKFIFNNNYNVYLHDTNARGLFSRENRALSHGCVRVHKAVQLAHYLAKDDDTYVGPEDLDQYLEVQHRMDVKVVRPIPVLLQYFTAFAADHKVEYYEDLYGKDEEILNALYHVTLHHAYLEGSVM